MLVAFRSRAADPVSASPAGEPVPPLVFPDDAAPADARLSRPEQGLAISRAIRLSAAATEAGSIMPASMETADGPVGASGHSSPELVFSILETGYSAAFWYCSPPRC